MSQFKMFCFLSLLAVSASAVPADKMVRTKKADEPASISDAPPDAGKMARARKVAATESSSRKSTAGKMARKAMAVDASGIIEEGHTDDRRTTLKPVTTIFTTIYKVSTELQGYRRTSGSCEESFTYEECVAYTLQAGYYANNVNAWMKNGGKDLHRAGGRDRPNGCIVNSNSPNGIAHWSTNSGGSTECGTASYRVCLCKGAEPSTTTTTTTTTTTIHPSSIGYDVQMDHYCGSGGAGQYCDDWEINYLKIGKRVSDKITYYDDFVGSTCKQKCDASPACTGYVVLNGRCNYLRNAACGLAPSANRDCYTKQTPTPGEACVTDADCSGPTPACNVGPYKCDIAWIERSWVPDQAGKQLEGGKYGYSLAQCKQRCDEEKNCKSFYFTGNVCTMSTMCVTASSAGRTWGAYANYKTYYRPCESSSMAQLEATPEHTEVLNLSNDATLAEGVDATVQE